MNYLLIKNGLVVSSNRVIKSDILIGNTKILEISREIARPVPDTPVIDADGRFVMPAAIDSSRHDFLEFDIEEEEIDKLLLSEISNGTTTIFETIIPDKRSKLGGMKLRADLLKTHHLSDYAFHLSSDKSNDFSSNDLLSSFVKSGVSSFSIQVNHIDDFDSSYIRKIIKSAEKFNLTLIIEVNQMDSMDPRCFSSNDSDLVDSYQHLCLLEQVLEKLKEATYPVLISKLRFSEEVAVFKRYLNLNKMFYAEVEMPYSVGEKMDVERDDQLFHGGIELNDNCTPISLLEFSNLVSNSHIVVSRPLYGLALGNSKDSLVYNRPDQYFNLKYFTSMLYTLTVIYGSLAITDFVSSISTRPAKLMGLYPQKGVLQAGSDADIVIWNPDYERNLFCNSSLISYEDEMKLQGRTEFVFSKGKMVYDGEVFYRENLTGHYLYRNPCL